MNNAIEYDITLDPEDEGWAFLSFKTPIGEIDNIGYAITDDIIINGLECLADHLKIMTDLELSPDFDGHRDNTLCKLLMPVLGKIADIEIRDPNRSYHFVGRITTARDYYITCGHPLDIDNHEVNSGGLGTSISQIVVRPAQGKDINAWRIETLKFMIESCEQDYPAIHLTEDSCYEDVTTAIPYDGPTIQWKLEES